MEVSELLLEVSVGKKKVRKSRKESEKRKRKSVGGGKKKKGKWKVDEVKSGLNEGKANVMGNGDHVRTCVYVRSNLIACLRAEGFSRDQVSVEICHNSSEKSLVVSSLYVENGKFHAKMLERVAQTPWMRSQRVIMGVDSNSRHVVWNSKASNKRDEKLLD